MLSCLLLQWKQPLILPLGAHHNEAAHRPLLQSDGTDILNACGLGRSPSAQLVSAPLSDFSHFSLQLHPAFDVRAEPMMFSFVSKRLQVARSWHTSHKGSWKTTNTAWRFSRSHCLSACCVVGSGLSQTATEVLGVCGHNTVPQKEETTKTPVCDNLHQRRQPDWCPFAGPKRRVVLEVPKSSMSEHSKNGASFCWAFED